ncbi:MAG: helix-turn-helix domain-containing protein [Victivallales bacterium]|nr:helix-turn-helix domain-containing protein [Victivallales bacterium]
MPNYTSVLNEEIARIAKREVKSAFEPLAARVIELKKKCSESAKKVSDIASKLEKLEKELGLEDMITVTVSEEQLDKARVSPKYIANVRKKYSLSRNEMALLLDVNPNSVYLWENGKSKPRQDVRGKIIQLREMGKRKIKELLSQFVVEEPKK